MEYPTVIPTFNVSPSDYHLRAVRFCLILGLILVAVPAYFYLEAKDIRLNGLSVLFLCLVAASSLALATFGSGDYPRPISTTFYAFVYVFLGMSPLLQVGFRQYPWAGAYDDTELLESAIMIATGLLGYLAGTILAKNMHPGFHKILGAGSVFDPKKLFLVSLGFVPIVLGCMQYLGGVARLFTPRLLQNDLAELTSVTNAVANNGMYVPCISFFLIFLSTCLSVKRGENGFLWSRSGTLLWMAIVFLISNPIGTPRYIFGAVVVAMLYFSTLRRTWIWPIFLIFSLLLVFPLADMFRSSLTVTTEHMPPAYEQIVYKPDFDSFQQIVNVTQYVEEHGFEKGMQALGAMLFFIPRDVWPDKPFATGQLVGDAMGYSMLNLSMPLWGEFFIDGGLVATFIGFLVYGTFCGVIEQTANATAYRGLAGVICIFFGAYQMYFLRGSLMVVVSYFVPFALLFGLCWKTCSVPIGFRAGDERRGLTFGYQG